MALDIKTAVNGSVVEITLSGELDAAAAPALERELQAVPAGSLKHLVLRVAGLTFLASAGVRTLIFARQKMGKGVDIYVIAPGELVLDTLRRTGVLTSVIVQSGYPLP